MLLDELARLARKHPAGVEVDMLSSVFVAQYHANRVTAGEPSLNAKRYNQTFRQTLEPMVEKGVVERLDGGLLCRQSRDGG